MTGIARLVGGIERKHFVLFGVVLVVALAGCSGADTTSNETTANGTAMPETTPAPGNGTGDGSGTSDGMTFGESLDSRVTPASELSVTTQEVVNSAVMAEDSTSEYTVQSNLTVRLQQNNVEQTQNVSSETSVDRAQRRVVSEQTVSVSGQTVSQRNYLVDGFLYQNSDAFASRYGSEWVKLNVSGNYSEQFRLQDELGLHGSLLENGSVELVGAQDVNGEATYRLRVEASGSEFAQYFGQQSAGNSNLTFTTVVWVDQDSGRIVRAEGRATTSSSDGSVTSTSTYVDTFTYGDVQVTLPKAAQTAVEIDRTGAVVN